jgi:hypothetical protein
MLRSDLASEKNFDLGNTVNFHKVSSPKLGRIIINHVLNGKKFQLCSDRLITATRKLGQITLRSDLVSEKISEVDLEVENDNVSKSGLV